MAKEFTSQYEANKDFKKRVKKGMDAFNTSQKAHVVSALTKMARKEVGEMRSRLKRHGKRGRKVAPDVDWSVEVETGKRGSYPTYSIGVFGPVFGKDRAENMDFAALLHTGAKEGKPMKLTAKAIEQKRSFNFFGNWPTIPHYEKRFRVKEGHVTKAIPSIEPDFLQKGEDNITRDIRREIPKAMKEAAKVIGYYARKQK